MKKIRILRFSNDIVITPDTEIEVIVRRQI